jgi:hypothetical protein
MKKLLCFLLLPFLGIAQLDFGQNATWHYSFSETGYTGYKKVSHVGDTIMYSMTWLRFEVTGLREIRTGPGPNDLVQNTAASWLDIFLATRNDSVFRMTAQGPYLLYDFNADIGDSWQFAPLDTTYDCPDTPIATVVGKGTEIINGQSLDYLDLRMPADTLIINGQATFQISAASYLSQRIYPKLGALSYNGLFESTPNLCNGSSFKIASLSTHSLRCFSDNDISLNRSSSSQACDYWSLLSTSELDLARLEVFPNPSAGTIRIKADLDITSLELMDLSGQKLKSYAKEERELRLPYQSGLYLLKVSFENGSQELVKLQRI